MTDKSDQELLKAFLDGDDGAFDTIVKRYSAPVYRLAYKFTHDVETAEDVTQDTFLRCYEYLKKNPKEVHLKPWLMTICVNLTRNLAKKKRNFNFSELSSVEEEHEAWEDRIPDKEKSPLEEVVRQEEVERVQKALAHLPKKYQLVLQMRYVEDLSYQEIADALQVPLNTVKVHINRAKEHLKQSLLNETH